MNMHIRTGEPHWLAPVYLRIGYGMPEAIHSTKEALHYLLFRWPAVRGPAYHRAKSICTVPSGNKKPCLEAREAFLLACIEAKVLD